ncbi:MAG: hypothetical protein JSR58_06080 [Verrucomicrobia bacterium]|nr:hypothetical protein [Verrucomicrobiota bacterium]
MGLNINNSIIKISCENNNNGASVEVKKEPQGKYQPLSANNTCHELNELKKAIISLVKNRVNLQLPNGPRLDNLNNIIIDKTPFLMDDVQIEFESNGKKMYVFFPANWGELSEINAQLKAIAAKSLESPAHSIN